MIHTRDTCLSVRCPICHSKIVGLRANPGYCGGCKSLLKVNPLIATLFEGQLAKLQRVLDKNYIGLTAIQLGRNRIGIFRGDIRVGLLWRGGGLWHADVVTAAGQSGHLSGYRSPKEIGESLHGTFSLA